MPSIGNDLVTIRTYLGLSVDDIRKATKIPLHTLEAIENNSIFEQRDEVQAYVRSFVRTYGRAIKLDDKLVVTALNQEELGSYNHQLLTAYPELAKEIPADSFSKPKETESIDSESTDPDDQSSVKPTDEKENDKASSPEEEYSPRFQPDFDNDEPAAEPTAGSAATSVRDVNWADMGRKMSSDRPGMPVWIIGAAVVIIVVVASLWFFTQTDETAELTDPDAPTSAESAPPGTNGGELSLDLRQEEGEEITDEPEQPSQLDETLYLTVYAATGNLDPVRVWSDLKPRMDPYWIDEGVAFNFEFRDTVRVRGPYSNILLFLNGHSIDNFRQDHFNNEENVVELTRDLFEDDPRWATTIPFELPPNVSEPDSVANRPAF